MAIAGVGLSPYARDRGATTELALVLEAAVAAIRDAGLTAADIDGVVGGGLLTGGIDPATVVSALGLPAVTWWTQVRAADHEPPGGGHQRGLDRGLRGRARLPLGLPRRRLLAQRERGPVPAPGRLRAARRPGRHRRRAHRRRAVEHARLGRLRRLGGPLPGGVRRLAGRLRPHRDQRPDQRGGQSERRAARAADHGRLPGRPDDPRAAVPVRHGCAGRRRGRVHRDHRRTGPRPALLPGPHPRGHHGHDRAARGAPGRRARGHRAAAGRPRPAGQERSVARRHRPVLPLRRVHHRGLALLRELRVLRSRRGRRVPGR